MDTSLESYVGTCITNTRVPDSVALAALLIPHPLYSRLDTVIRNFQTR